VGIEAWLTHNRLRTRHDVFVLCLDTECEGLVFATLESVT